MESVLKLFKALPIGVKRRKKASKALLEKTIPLGFVFSPEVVASYSNYDKLINMIEKIYGLSAEKLNQSFHKSWQKVKNTDMEQLVVEQIAHYLTTYGKEYPVEYLEEKEVQWGVEDLAEKVAKLPDIEVGKVLSRDADYVYIPKEVLKIPYGKVGETKLVIIKGYTKAELKTKLLKLLNSGIALGEETINDVVDVALFVEVNGKDIDGIRNKEVRAVLYDYLNMLPENPTEFLRFIVYKATEKTLLIKSPALIAEIKEKKHLNIIKLFKDYNRQYGLEKLAEIFYRFKPLFLAFRANRELKTIINKIRKLAVEYHKPMPEDYLNTVTAKIKNNEKIRIVDLKKELSKVNTFRKIRLAYALKFRTKDVDSILYRIRNGKSYATDFSFENKLESHTALSFVLESIIEDINKNVKGKKIYIPEYITYTLPATEKQFTGFFPSGTYVSISKDMIFGIHWENVNSNRIDLDLSVISDTGKIGWDREYRNEEKSILFSGDITDARRPKGATELFYVKRQAKNALILFVNYYNFEEDVEVPFKIIVAKEKAKDFKANYMVNPNNVLSVANSKINQQQKILGLAVTTINECRFYFAETNIGRSITSSNSSFVEHSRKYLFNFYENTISLNDILVKAGAKLVKDKDKSDINLSPENLEKDTILNLING